MNFREIISYALVGLRYRKLRSMLTALGVIIGIASIVILIALAQGLDRAVREQITSIGTNFIQVVPGKPFESASFGPPVFKGALYERDTDSLRRLPGIIGISSLISPGYGRYVYKNSTYTAIITGIEPEAFDYYVKTVGMETGEFLKGTDHTSLVMGNQVAKTAFKEEVTVGKIVYINDVPFRVKGVINPSPVFDLDIYVDKHAAGQFIAETEDPTRIFGIFIITDPEREVAPIAAQVERIVANNHKVPLDEADFSVFTADTILQSIGIIFGLLSVFLGMVAGISLIVGSIGIANAMFTSVLERTREIGILKAVGAQNRLITRIFMIESAMLGALGGILGVALAIFLIESARLIPYLLAGIIDEGTGSAIRDAAGLLAFSPELVGGAFLVSLAVGVVSGYFPAKRAEELQPVEALRYE